MNIITFVAPFPNKNNIKDGLVIRVAAIDKLFENDSRMYLDISLTKHLKKKKEIHNNVTVHYLNFFLHTYTIVSLCLSSSIIYCHTLGRILRIIIPLLFFSKKYKLVLDIHGTDPEQAEYNKQIFLYYLLSWTEKLAFKKIDALVSVTKYMEDFYKEKYPKYKNQYLRYTILPNIVLDREPIDGEKRLSIKEQFNINDDDIIVIYSGGIHKWQKIDEMISLIKSNINGKIKYFILTNNLLEIRRLLDENDLKEEVTSLSLDPSELMYYYDIAHYGFVIRDKHILNKVACPTKLIEYMNYGIIPIVDLVEIGDFNETNYSYLHKDMYKIENLTNKKNASNQLVIQKIISNNDKTLFYREITK